MSYAPSHNPQGNPDRRLGVNNEPAFEIMDLFYALFRWRWFIIFFTILSAVISFFLATTRDLEYQAVTSVLINPLGINVIEGDINTRTESPDVNIALIESQMHIMESRPVIRQTIKNLNDPNWVGLKSDPVNLLDDPELNGKSVSLKSLVLKWIGFGEEVTEETYVFNVISSIRENIAVYRPQLGYVVDLNYRSSDPEKAALIANAVAATYLELESQSNSDQARKAAVDLESQLERLRSQLQKAEEAVEDHKRKNGIVSAAGGLANELEFTQVQEDLIEARNKAAAAKITLDTVEGLRRSGTIPQNLPEVIRSTSIANLRTQLSLAKQKQISLSAQYLATHPVMRAAELAVEDAENSVREEIALIAEAAQFEYNNALKAELELKSKVEGLTESSFETNDARIKLRDLERDAQAKKVVFESFLLRASELGQQADVDTNKAEIVSPASEPQTPINLPGVIVMAGGTIFGFMLSSAIVLVGTGVATLNRSLANYGANYEVKHGSQGAVPFQPKRHREQSRNEMKMSRQKKTRNTNSSKTERGRQSGSLLKNIFRPNNEEFEEHKAHKSSKRHNASKSKKKSKPSYQSLNIPLLHSLEIDRSYLMGDTIPFLHETSPGEKFAKLVDEINTFSSRKRTRVVLVTGFEDSFGKSVLAGNLAFAGFQQGYNCACIGMDSENRYLLKEFSEGVAKEFGSNAARQVVGGGETIAIASNGFRNLFVRHLDKNGSLQADVELMKLKDHLHTGTTKYDIVFFDAPLLDQENQLEKTVELADEVIVAMPKNAIGKLKASAFARLGAKSKRIRGLVTTKYYTN